ncbi:MAG: aminopeptidase N [Bacteriovorax sp. MedPE-SWde]|nr:MAG: aminopeptidase N [Bacteriovorax sp. MedPE-SWde]
MKGETPQAKFLKDYKEPTHLVSELYLTFDLHDTQTKVKNEMKVKHLSGTSLLLDGEELTFVSAKVNGELVSTDNLKFVENTLEIINLPESDFDLVIENTIDPKANTALDGLYMSSGIFCTQNEPEGFRRITYFIDRPDNLSVYTTKVIADKSQCPILLSNGNLVDSGELENGKHFAIWNDPFPKPAYLYALVAGDLGMVQDSYTTGSGREIDLRIYVDKGNESKCNHAMESLKNSMKWDEERFGLEYDLDIYMVVAVDSFNMGAMENKGLNIFNSAYVLADRETATDDNFFGIESVIGHEYFHNWTGNRVTCRDWFQLTLKEGLTVFRDQEFSADLNSRAVCRINDVNGLRGHQFTEDGGPTAHPIKPKSYIEMNNFYTSTIYEKGSEVIRMIHTLLGEEGFRKGMDKYFELFDGQAVTTEDFVHSMSVANNDYDFSQFMLWYDQAGTPVVNVESSYNKDAKELTLKVAQSCPATPGQDTKKPFHMPLAIGLVTESGSDLVLNLKDANGQDDISRGVLNLRKESEEFVFTGVSEKVVPSINRQFSAPIRLRTDLSNDDMAFLMGSDSDEFNRFESCNVYAKDLLLKMCATENYELDEKFANAWGKVLTDSKIDEAFKSVCLSLPSVGELAQEQAIHNYAGLKRSVDFLEKALAERFETELRNVYSELNVVEEFKVDAASMGKRSLKGRVLSLIGALDNGQEIVRTQYNESTNMTDRMSSMRTSVFNGHNSSQEVLADFYKRFKDNTLVMQKWFMTQASGQDDSTYDNVIKLLDSDVYDKNVPNLVRSLIGAFARNEVQFNHESGRGIKFISAQIKEIDGINPQVASRLASAFRDLKHMPKNLQDIARAELEGIVKIEGLSKNVYEIVSKTLA